MLRMCVSVDSVSVMNAWIIWESSIMLDVGRVQTGLVQGARFNISETQGIDGVRGSNAHSNM